MKFHRSSRLLLLAGSAALFPTTPVLAQTDSTAVVDDGAIVVTARRIEESLQDVPISISVVSQDQIDQRNISTASDLASYTPGLSVDTRYGPDKGSFIIRGSSQLPVTSPTVAVYFADVVAPRAQGGTSGGNGAGPGNLFDLQNVQVLKGPQGTLFGRNTTGGAILLVPKKPTDKLEGYLEGSLGNYGMKRVQAVLNLPLADTFKVRLGMDRQVRDGYLHNQSGIGPHNFGDVDYWAFRGSIVAELTPDLENYTVARYSRSDTNGTMYRMIGCNRGDDPADPRTGRATYVAPAACDQIDRQNARGDGFYDVENMIANPYHQLREWQIINTTTWTASDALTVKNIISYGEHRERFHTSIGGERFFVSADGPPVAPVGTPFNNVIIRNAPGQYGAAQSTFTEELQFQGQAAEGSLIWQAGAYLEISEPLSGGNTTYSQNLTYCTDNYAFQCQNVVPGSGLSLVANQEDFRNIGFYGQATYDITDRLAVTGGLRYTMDRTTGSGRRISVAFPTPNNPVGHCANPLIMPGVETLTLADCDSGKFVEKSNRPTWTIDVEYKPIPNLMGYMKYSRGYRQGGINPSNIGLEVWDPETVDAYEVGAKVSFVGTVRGYFNIAGFYNSLRDQQLSAIAIGCTVTTCGYDSGIPGARVVVNAGKSRIYGIDIDSSFTFFDSLRLDVGYAYLDTKLQEFIAPVLPSNSPYAMVQAVDVGGPLPLTPKHRVTVSGAYTLPIDQSIGRISIGATYVHTSTQLADSASAFGIVPASDLVNLNFDWKSVGGSRFDLGAFMTNLTKEETYLNTTGNWSSLGYENVVTNLPRMYGLRLRYNFGQ
jgi:iron complex outermembrane receptor protein